MDKPKIFANCPAGCLWETVHRDEFLRSAAYCEERVDEEGFFHLKKGQLYKIFAPKTGYDFQCGLAYYYKQNGVVTEFEIEIENEDIYADSFTFKLVNADFSYGSLGDYMLYLDYEVNGLRYSYVSETVFEPLELIDDCLKVTAAMPSDLKVFMYNDGTSVVARDGNSAFIRFSANADGTDFTETWSSGQNYVGFATAQEAPTDKSRYIWCKFIN